MPKRKRKDDDHQQQRTKKYNGSKGNRFSARIFIDGKSKYIGMFHTPEEAAHAYDLGAIQAGRLQCELNFKDGEDNNEEDGTSSTKDNVKYKGVYKRGERFQAILSIDGKQRGHGMFDTPKEAAIAYDHAAIQAGRPTSTLNFLDQVPKDYKYKDITIYKGVFDAGTKFKAVLEIGKKSSYLGVFDTMKEAAIAYDLAAIQAGHPTSSLNFPQGRKSKK